MEAVAYQSWEDGSKRRQGLIVNGIMKGDRIFLSKWTKNGRN